MRRNITSDDKLPENSADTFSCCDLHWIICIVMLQCKMGAKLELNIDFRAWSGECIGNVFSIKNCFIPENY